MGLRATASIDYSITDKFVPAYRAFEYPLLTDGNPRHPSALGLVELGRPGMTAFASGIGFRALAELITAAPKPSASSPKGCRPTITSCHSGSASWREGCALSRSRRRVGWSDCRGPHAGSGALDAMEALQIPVRLKNDCNQASENFI